MNAVNRILRPLRGANLEVFKFGMYLMFPIGWMYYFGTNLQNRFSVEGFWPTSEQSHKIPYEKEEIRAEVERIQREMRNRREGETKSALAVLARDGFASTRQTRNEHEVGSEQPALDAVKTH